MKKDVRTKNPELVDLTTDSVGHDEFVTPYGRRDTKCKLDDDKCYNRFPLRCRLRSTTLCILETLRKRRTLGTLGCILFMSPAREPMEYLYNVYNRLYELKNEHHPYYLE
ncbi:uncharacterized protein [Arachis hypogaea]|uniref:uncharacterized protein isoform X3 n=1 Tax=Arachis hypogaea TaxID=3818 RepID=UPI003B226401